MHAKNLTGEQIQTILDLYLYKALREVIDATDLFDQQLSYLLSICTRNRKRKVVSVEREVAISYLCSAIAATTPDEKLHWIKQARIERWFIHVFISRFLSEFADFRPMMDSLFAHKTKRQGSAILQRAAIITNTIGSKNSDTLYIALRNSAAYMKKFYEYRDVVVEHYLKHSAKRANAYVKAKGTGYAFDDIKQTILKNVLVAIDKYDSSRGALTSYVGWWILNAQTCAAPEHEYGIAYTVPQAHRKKLATGASTASNFSVSLDSLQTSEDEEKSLHELLADNTDILTTLEAEQDQELVRYLVKSSDPMGLVRLSLDIDEFFTRKELRRMRKITLATDAELSKSVKKLRKVNKQ
jgi:hypothetical protein